MTPIARRALLLAAAATTILPLSGCADRLLPSEFDQNSPAINGENVVWEDSRNADTGNGTDLFAYNTGSLVQTPVAVGAGEQDQPAISNSYIVWIDEGRLMARNISAGPPFGPPFSVTNGPATQTNPAVCGSLVVWSDPANNSNVYAKDLSIPGGPVINVATSDAVEAYPACDAGRVVYSYSPLGESSIIRLYNIATGQTTVVSSETWNEWRPSISGNRVVWQAWPGQPSTPILIFGTNLPNGPDFVVSPAGSGHQTAPVISGSTVAWEDVRSGHSQIWWRDVATTMPPGIPVEGSLPGSQQAVSLFGRRAVFQGNAEGPWNTYLGQLFFFTGTG
jgi:hypothetical protein